MAARWSMRSKLPLVVASTAAVALIATAAWAAIPDSSGRISACADVNGGRLRVIDTEAGQTCSKNERPISWTATPVESLPDSFVALSTHEVFVPPARMPIASLSLPAGNYEVTAKVLLTSRQESSTATVACELVPASEDGTPGNAGAPPADPGALLLAPPGEAGSAGTLNLGVSQALSQPGAVVLSCVASGGASVASNAWIRAVEVESITTGPGQPPLP